MANKNFEIKNGLTVAGTERITSAGAGSLTNLTLSGNLTVQGTTVTLDASTLQVADKNIVLNYHASNDTSSASSGAGITIQDAVNGTTDATILWDASDDEFDFSHTINIPNLKVSGAQGTDGQLLTSTGSGIAWEDAPASGPTFKAFGTSSIMVGDNATGTINGANYNTGLGVDVFQGITTADSNTAIGFEAGKSIISGGESNVFVGSKAGKLNNTYQSTYIGTQAGENVTGNRGVGIGYLAMAQNIGSTTGDVAIGFLAMQYKDTTDGGSIAIGQSAMRGVTNNKATGKYNVAIGQYAMQNYTSAASNTAIGQYTLNATTTGTHNVAIGVNAGQHITTGSKNVIIGSYDGNENSLDIRTSSNNIVLSDGDANIRMYINSSGKVGIGNTAPAQMLSVSGTSSAAPGRFTATGNTNTLEIWGNSTASTSTGLLCNAGTNENDYSAKFRNYAGSTIMEVRGDSVIDIFGTTRLQDNNILALGQSSDTRIYYDGSDSLYITATHGTANAIKTSANNTYIMQANGNQLITAIANSEVVINNDSSASIDFRVESDNQAYNFFCDASSEIIHFGEGTNSDTQSVIPAGTLAGRRHSYHGGNKQHAGQTFKYCEGVGWTDAIKIDWHNVSWGAVCLRITGMYYYSASNNFSIVIGLQGYGEVGSSSYGSTSVSYDATSSGAMNWTNAIQLAQSATGETMIRQRAGDTTGDVIYRYEWQCYARSNQPILIIEQ